MRRTLGLWQTTISGIGIVIGAGIYVLVGSAAREAGSGLWLSFLLAALLSALTGLSYAELASMFPSASAEYEFSRQAFNEFLGFVTGWMMIAANVIAAAAVAVGFAHYLEQFVDIDVRVAAAALLVALTAVVMSGVQRSIWFSALLVVLQIGGLLLVIAAGAPHIGSRDLLAGSTAGGILRGGALVFFAFIGFDEIVTLSEETRDPQRTIPRALLLALGISTLLYMLVGIAAVSVVGADALASSERSLTLVIAHDWGDRAADILAFIALASTTNTTLLVLTAASRLVFGMAKEGSLPPFFAALSGSAQAPARGAAVALAVALGFALIGTIETIASATDFAVYVVFIFVNVAVVVLRFRQPATARGFRTPFSIGGVPVTPLLGIVTVVVLMAFLERSALEIGGGVLLAGLIAWPVLRRSRVPSTE